MRAHRKPISLSMHGVDCLLLLLSYRVIVPCIRMPDGATGANSEDRTAQCSFEAAVSKQRLQNPHDRDRILPQSMAKINPK